MATAALPDPLPIRPRGPIDARLRPPGSRSITNRALIAAGLADGRSRLRGVTASDDTEAMREGLRALGVPIRDDETARDTWALKGVGGALRAPDAPLDVRLSGTTARFLTAIASLADGPVTIDGRGHMRKRPIGELVDAMAALGAPCEILGENRCPPLRVAGGGLPGGSATIDARRSGQFVSGLLLAAPFAKNDVELRFVDDILVSRSFVDLTLDVMCAFGAEVDWREGGRALYVRAGVRYEGREYAVEPDAQSAVYPFVAAAISGGRIVVDGLPAHSEQTDLGVLGVLEAMGCTVERLPDAIALRGPDAAHGLRGVEADMNAFPDAVLAVAVAALFADGPTTIRNVPHLRVKETDRMAALEAELTRLGAAVETGDDWLRITPGPLRPASIRTYDDHRMAMSFALAGLRAPGIVIEDPGCVAKTWPDFFAVLDRW